MSSGELRERLQRLRRDVERAAEDRARTDALRAELHAHALRRARREPAGDTLAPVDAHDLGRRPQAGDPPGLSSAALEGGEVVARESSFDAAFRHGDWSLSEIADAERELFALLTDQPHLARVDLERCVYLDTETTGLSGGAGTYVFLIGLGTFERGRFHVWQGFLREPSGERALLGEVARRIASRPHIVSFFGKSFDRHRLEDRMRCHGIDVPCFDREHLDLFHPLRRLYKGALPDTRLRTVEAELCGVIRENDLSGAHAPQAWFEFVHGRAHELDRVFRHNLDDVLSLVVLAAHLGASRREAHARSRAEDVSVPIAGPGDARARALACAFATNARFPEAMVWFQRAIERSRDGERGARLDGAHAKKFGRLHARTRRALGVEPDAE